MNVRILGAHRCESETSRCASLLIDDTLALDAGGLAATLPISTQLGLKAILLTHHHYDHIRDVPMVAINLFLHGASVGVYSSPAVRDLIQTHLLNGLLYPKFQEIPASKPTLRFQTISPSQSEVMIEGYRVLAIPVNHADTTYGYQISNGDGQVVFYAADTGPGLLECWKRVSAQTIIIEVTLPNRYEEFAISSAHLTPNLLSQELKRLRELRGDLPRVIITHLDPSLEGEIREEIAGVAEAIASPIMVAHEGMRLHLRDGSFSLTQSHICGAKPFSV